ncbi:hypothetical protein EHS25_008993 [Saitozyma podzolica]|uniref:DNA damage-binding protein CMR1 n=1 Tax=Saitozyma podzolica TaxID=1890683 RepID=A0A427YKK3_9TREE|nr:hypothetical protein EHS25_008993 [Saitozyma podzolica]
MDDEDNDYEIERQRIIAENRLLLSNLGLDPSGAAHLNFPKPPPKAKPAHPSGGGRKRKSEAADVAPRRRSGRIAGLEAEGEELAVKVEEERKAMEAIRVINRKEREQRMELGKMVEDESEEEVRDLETYLQNTIAPLSNPRKYPSTSTSSSEAYAEKDTQPAELARLKDAFRGMSLRANAKVTSERVFSMVVHPEKSKTVVLVGDKYGGLGIWDALGPAAEQVKDEDDTSGIKEEDQDESEGRVWRVQAHARNSITAMKVDPVNGSGLFSSSYDCSLRHLDFSTLISSELFAFTDEDMLVTHFDLVPSGQEAWIADKNGGISHCDFREGKGSRRRWVVQEEGRAAKLGGMSVNRAYCN